jgi:hypothetical protein
MLPVQAPLSHTLPFEQVSPSTRHPRYPEGSQHFGGEQLDTSQVSPMLVPLQVPFSQTLPLEQRSPV